MNTTRQFGEEFEVKLVQNGRKDAVIAKERVNGRVAIVRDPHSDALLGDVWLVKLGGGNSSKTVHFIDLVRLVKAGDGLDDVLAGVSTYHFARIRATARLVQASRDACLEGSVGLAAALAHAVADSQIESRYRATIAREALGIWEANVGSDHAKLIPSLTVLAYTAATVDPEKEESYFARLLLHLRKYGGSKKRIVGALVNLGRILLAKNQYEQALAHYEEAYTLEEDFYIQGRKAACLVALSRFQEACTVLTELTAGYFAFVESESSSIVNQCEVEDYFDDSRN